jgi:biopolymer transport protein ExbD
MRFKIRARRKGRVLINITSLIDVLFLLLIFFMVSSTFLEQPGIQLELPEAKSSVLVEQKEFTLFVNQNGTLFLNDSEISLKDLETRIREVLPRMKDVALILKADKDVNYGLVVEVIDAVKNSGLKKLIIGTRIRE